MESITFLLGELGNEISKKVRTNCWCLSSVYARGSGGGVKNGEMLHKCQILPFLVQDEQCIGILGFTECRGDKEEKCA